ncbi:hypothetical protein [Dulcicalothrix desertica]|uniref:hypothetical protein n=1 Tax=Dulcicalothrix desertica TaxID=32056 RepID=UPI001F1CCC5E|nr:hypothetical protein [Dulcicalothrix desertica]
MCTAPLIFALRYSRGYIVRGNEILPGAPWGEYKVPFVFATNGRPFLRQLETKSGIWFCDVRKPSNIRRSLSTLVFTTGFTRFISC